jgi:ribosome maturation factor RimP
MIVREDIIAAAEAALAEIGAAGKTGAGDGNGLADEAGGLFLVDVKAAAGDEFEVFIDSDGRVTLEDCASLTKAIESRFDRDADDFSLTVSSAGIGQPLKVPRQYRKLIGRNVEVVLAGGAKFVAVLDAADQESITVTYPEKQKVEGQKKPQTVNVTRTWPLTGVKTTKEHIDFK